MAFQETKQITETVSVSLIQIHPALNPLESKISMTYGVQYDKEGQITNGVEGSIQITGADVVAVNPNALAIIIAIADAFNPRNPNKRSPL